MIFKRIFAEVSYFFTIGFSYIVEVAIVYLEKQKEK